MGTDPGPQIKKIIKDYEKFIKEEKRKSPDDYNPVMSIPQRQIKVTTIQYLNKNGYSCHLVGAGDICHWHIIKDNIGQKSTFCCCCR